MRKYEKFILDVYILFLLVFYTKFSKFTILNSSLIYCTKQSLSNFFREPETPSFWCKPCTLQCSSQVDYDMHCSGKSHFKKVAMQSAVGTNIIETPNTCQSVNVVTVSRPPQLALNIEAAAFK